ncbi:MAG: o-succinylbenzoate synthase, partial [Caldithrix sp. RBG_13_44_9]
FSRESLEEVTREVQQVARFILDWEIDSSFLDSDGDFQKGLKNTELSPSTSFGIEMGLLNLLASAQKCYLPQLFSLQAAEEIYVNALLNYDTGDIKAAVKKLLAEGYQTIKLKVGQGRLEEDVRRVQELREAAGEKVLLRLDANQAWSLTDAVRFGNSVRELEIEYIEEPLQDPAELSTFYGECGIPAGLDESLLTLDPDHYNWNFAVKAIILKPMFLGGISRVIRLLQHADGAGIYPVFSSVYESGVTLSVLVQLAAAFSPPGIAMGLDTYKWLKEDLLQNPFRVEQGRVEVKKIAANARLIDFEKLELQYKI